MVRALLGACEPSRRPSGVSAKRPRAVSDTTPTVERAQQPIDAIGSEAARRGDRGMVLGAVLHDVGKAEPRKLPHRPGHPQAAQQLQHLLVQQRRGDDSGALALLSSTIHPAGSTFPSPRAANAMGPDGGPA